MGFKIRDAPVFQRRTAVAWFILLIAGLLEIVWTYFMKQSEGFTRMIPTAITLLTSLASFGLLAVAMKTLPLGTAYTVWTGIGAVGAFAVGIVVLGEPANVTRIVAAALIVAGIVLMKVSSTA
jgi:quaternary ammonium compound-resistance protein SugE